MFLFSIYDVKTWDFHIVSVLATHNLVIKSQYTQSIFYDADSGVSLSYTPLCRRGVGPGSGSKQSHQLHWQPTDILYYSALNFPVLRSALFPWPFSPIAVRPFWDKVLFEKRTAGEPLIPVCFDVGRSCKFSKSMKRHVWLTGFCVGCDVWPQGRGSGERPEAGEGHSWWG